MHKVRERFKDPKQAEAQVQMMLDTMLREEVPDENPKDWVQPALPAQRALPPGR